MPDGRLEHPHRRPAVGRVLIDPGRPLEGRNPVAPALQRAPVGIARVAVLGHHAQRTDLVAEPLEHAGTAGSSKCSASAQRIAQQEKERQRNAVVAGGVLGRIAQPQPFVPGRFGGLPPGGRFGEFGEKSGRQGQSGGTGYGLVEYPPFELETRLPGE